MGNAWSILGNEPIAGARWEPPPTTRGSFQILMECLLTLLLCAWTAVHLNISALPEPELDTTPKPKTWLGRRIGKPDFNYKKMKYLILTVVAPEITTVIAFMQWMQKKHLWHYIKEYTELVPLDMTSHSPTATFPSNASRDHNTRPGEGLQAGPTRGSALDSYDEENSIPLGPINAGTPLQDHSFQNFHPGPIRRPPSRQHYDFGKRRHCWTEAHCWFAVAGGFVIQDYDDKPFPLPNGLQRMTILPEGIKQLAKHYPEVTPKLRDEEIKARSKANIFAKLLVCAQVIWFCANMVGRIGYHLPLTVLELSTAAHCVCALLTYCFWWNKPYNVTEPVPILIDEETAPEIAAMCLLSWEGRHVRCATSPESLTGKVYFKLDAYPSLYPCSHHQYQLQLLHWYARTKDFHLRLLWPASAANILNVFNPINTTSALGAFKTFRAAKLVSTNSDPPYAGAFDHPYANMDTEIATLFANLAVTTAKAYDANLDARARVRDLDLRFASAFVTIFREKPFRLFSNIVASAFRNPLAQFAQVANASDPTTGPFADADAAVASASADIRAKLEQSRISLLNVRIYHPMDPIFRFLGTPHALAVVQTTSRSSENELRLTLAFPEQVAHLLELLDKRKHGLGMWRVVHRNQCLTSHYVKEEFITNGQGDKYQTSWDIFPPFLLASPFYAALHALAWHGPFRTDAEKYLWRMAVLAFAPVFCSQSLRLWKEARSKLPLFARMPVWLHRRMNGGWLPQCLLISLYCSMIGFVIGRTFLLVESFLTLPYAPEDAFKVPEWATYFPHFG